MGKLTRTPEGYILLDGYKFGERNRNAREVDIDGQNYFFKIDPLCKWFRKSKIQYQPNTLAESTYMYLNELYISRIAPYFNINSVKYDIAKRGKDIGVISKDFRENVEGETLINNVLNVPFYYPRNDLKYVMENIDNEKVTKNIVPDLQNLALFDFVTLQSDRNNTNVMLTKSKEDRYDNIITLDHGYTGLAMEGRRSKHAVSDSLDSAKTFLNVYMNDVYETTMGIEKTYSKTDDFLNEVSSSKYMPKSVVENFLKNLDGFLTKGIIKDIHSELVEEYNVPVDTRYEEILSYSMETMGKKLEDAYSSKKENNIDENSAEI